MESMVELFVTGHEQPSFTLNASVFYSEFACNRRHLGIYTEANHHMSNTFTPSEVLDQTKGELIQSSFWTSFMSIACARFLISDSEKVPQ